MAIEQFHLRDVQWSPTRIGVVVLAVVSALIHFALAAITGASVFALLAIGLLVGFVIFLTELWSPVLYLVGAVYVGVMTVIWLLEGMPEPLLGGVDKAIQAVLFVLFLYLLGGGQQRRAVGDDSGADPDDGE